MAPPPPRRFRIPAPVFAFLSIAALAAVAAAGGGCVPAARVRPASGFEGGGGRILVTLEPAGADAARLRLTIGALAAVREDGTALPLPLVLSRIDAEVMARERVLAAGGLPDGTYRGLEIRLTEAVADSEQGEGQLAVPEEPALLPVAFSVGPRAGAVVSLTLDLNRALAAGFRFEPAFVARVPEQPPTGLVGYAALPGLGALAAFQKRTGRITGVTPVGRSAGGVAIDTVRRRVFVTLPEDDALAAVDFEQGALIETRPLRGGDRPADLALAAGGALLVVANEGSASVSIVEADGLVERARVPVGDAPAMVLVDSTGLRAYVPCARANRVDVVDPQRETRIGSFPTDPGPLRVQLDRREERLFVIHEASPQMLVFDVRTGAVVRRLFVGPGQAALKVDPQTDRLYLGRARTGVIEIFDPHSLLAIDRIAVPSTPAWLTVDRDVNALVVSLPGSRELLSIGLVSRAREVAIDTGAPPGRLAIAGER